MARFVAVAALALAFAATARAATPYVVGTASSPVAADSHFAAYAAPDGNVRLYDDRRGEWSTVNTPAGCSFVSYGGGAILWACHGGAHVLDIASAQTADVAIDPQSGVTLTRVGARWIEGGGIGHDPFPLWIDWRSGSYASPRALDSPRVVPDLNRSSLHARLCRGMRRRADPSADTLPNPFLPFLYERPYGVQVGSVRGDRGRMVVRRCEHRRAVTLQGSADASLSDGLLTWTRGSRVLAYGVRSGRLATWRFRPPLLDVAHSRSRIFVSTAPREGPWRILAIRRPRRL